MALGTSMHSNLRTEKGYWNHLFLPEAMRVFSYQDHLITLISSDQPDFDAIRREIPCFEFRRWSRGFKEDFQVIFRDEDGVVRRFDKSGGRGSDALIMAGHPLLEKFLCFHPIGAGYDYIPEGIPHVGPARNMIPRRPREAPR